MQNDQTIRPLPTAVDALMRRKRLMSIGLPLAIIAYLLVIYFALGIPSAFEKAKWKNGSILIADSMSYKTILERSNRGGQVKVSIENEKSGTYDDDSWPDWIARDGEVIDVTLDGDVKIVIDDDRVTLDVPDYGVISTIVSRRGLDTSYPGAGAPPAWVNASKTRLTATLPDGRLTITKSKTTVFKYSAGWELFFFTMDSPYYGKSWGEIVGLMAGGDLFGIVNDVWNNKIWHHSKVAWAIGETILMAFLGTIGAALLALPLAFLAAINFSPARVLRFGSR